MTKRFSQFHPLVTFSYYIGSLSLVMLMLHPVFLMVAFLIILAINFTEDRCRGLRRWLFLMITSSAFIIILNPIFNERGRHVLYVINDHRFTLEAILYGGMTALSIVAVITLFVSYNEVMTPNKLLYLFSGFLPQFAILLMLTLRFIPLMKRRLEEISAIQTSKGISALKGNWKARARSGLLYIQVLLTFSLEEAIQTADSMKARGYGAGKRSSYEFFRLTNTDIVTLLYLLSLFLLIIYDRLNGFGFLTIYPMMESMKLSYMDYMTLVKFLLFMCLPLLVEIGVFCKWRLLN